MKFSLFIVSLPKNTPLPVLSSHTHDDEEKPTIENGSPIEKILDTVTMKYLKEAAVTPVDVTPVRSTPTAEIKPITVEQADKKLVTFEELLTGVMTRYKILNSSWLDDNNNKKTVVIFTVLSGRLEEEIFELLLDNGVGTVENSSVNITPVTLAVEPTTRSSAPSEEQAADQNESAPYGEVVDDEQVDHLEQETEVATGWTDNFVKSIQARIIMRPVIDGLKRNAEFTFDYLMFIIIASSIATIGLIQNSSVILVASMLISPLMGPILAKTFGAAILDKNLTLLGLGSTAAGLAICVVTGFVVSLPAVYIVPEVSWINVWPTSEMYSRGATHNLIVGAVVAFFSGAGVALSVLGENTASLVGVAISGSLLPPAVNAGLLWALSFSEFTRTVVNSPVTFQNNVTCPQISPTFKEYMPYYTCNMSRETALLGLVSVTLTLINILCIIIGALIFLKIKEVTPNASNKDERQFWMDHVIRSRESQQQITDISVSSSPMKEVNDIYVEHTHIEIAVCHDAQSAEAARAKTTRQLENLASSIESNPTYLTVKNKYKPSRTPTTIIRDLIDPKSSLKSLRKQSQSKKENITLPVLAELGSDRFAMYRS